MHLQGQKVDIGWRSPLSAVVPLFEEPEGPTPTQYNLYPSNTRKITTILLPSPLNASAEESALEALLNEPKFHPDGAMPGFGPSHKHLFKDFTELYIRS